ncbi:MAG TPA: efflux transporter outer membrane subunit [Steroidobacteraceae bacterium]|jgi:NodT family efflux transporter outer membrane factor (OMF) lipoprotein|nr:efflux transporter outer membrane subunit [Steroidobacteraceae bacterium]
MSAAVGAMLGMLLLAACATLPPHPGAAPTPLSSSQLGLAGPTFAPAPAAWWQALGDPQLDRLMDAALRDNPRLAEANARWQDAEAQAAASAASQLPAANFKASEERLKVPAGFGPYLLGGRSVWFGSLGAALSWDPDLWGRHADQDAAAHRLSAAADMDRAEARLLLSGALVQAYLQLDRADALEDIASDTQAQRARIVEITRRRVAAGLDTRVELREAEGEVPQTHLALLQAQAEEALARHELAALVGRGADVYASIQRPHLNVPALQALPASLPINLLARRPDVIAARQRIAAADAERSAARAAFYPSINLSALASFASVSLSNLISAESFGYGAGPALTLPIFDGGRLRAQYRGAQAELGQAVASYDDIVLGAVHQAADQITLIDSLAAQQQQQAQWLDAAQEAYRLDEERYRAGLASYLSVLDAETDVFNARRTAVELHNQRASARITLLIALGGSFSPSGAPDMTGASPARAARADAPHSPFNTGN